MSRRLHMAGGGAALTDPRFGSGSASARSAVPAEPGTGLLWDLVPAFALVGVAAVGAAVGLGGVMRLLYPCLALALGVALLGTRRIGAYVCLCVWLFVLTPWLRRWVDLQSGWLRANPVMLAPYAAVAPCLLMLLRMVAGPSFRLAGGMLLAILAGGYGLVLAVLQGSIAAAVFDWLRYAAPPCFAALIMVSMPRNPSIPGRVVRTLAIAAALSGAYGVYQFTLLPPWDAMWMRNAFDFAGLNSIGQPEPFEVRVFSLMNSPHSFAAFLGAAMPFLLALPTPLHLLSFAFGAAGLMLSLARSYWLAFIVALGYLIARGPFKQKAQAAAGVVALVLLLPALAALSPEAAKQVDTRIASLTAERFETDVSYQSRASDFEGLADKLDRQPLGEGLATGVILDGQIMETYHALGLFAGTLYLGAAFYCFAASFSMARRGCPPLILAASAVTLEALLAAPLTSSLIGEMGMFSWLALALCHAPWRRAGRAPSPR